MMDCTAGNVDISEFDIMPRMRSYLARAGYHSLLSNVSPGIMQRAKEIFRVGLDSSKPIAVYADLSCDEISDTLIPDKLSGSKSFTMFFFSLGIDFDKRVAGFFAAREALSAVLLDAWGSEAVEALAVNVDTRFRAERGQGSIRFAPGYGNFDIRNNARWMDIMRERIGFSIPAQVDTNTGILSPTKSILCMIGWV